MLLYKSCYFINHGYPNKISRDRYVADGGHQSHVARPIYAPAANRCSDYKR